ncbi:hypothetical protein EMCRGX_G000018 [Ephydatia muelleri]
MSVEGDLGYLPKFLNNPNPNPMPLWRAFVLKSRIDALLSFSTANADMSALSLRFILYARHPNPPSWNRQFHEACILMRCL